MAWSRSSTLLCAGRCRNPASSWKGSSMSVIAITEVKKRFGDNEVLKGISIDVAPGEVVAIIGRSGSGKSTLLRCINGLETIDGGRIVAAGVTVQPSRLREVRRSVGMIFQSFNL